MPEAEVPAAYYRSRQKIDWADKGSRDEARLGV